MICNNKPAVKEYYEMTKEEQEAVDEKHELHFRYGVVLNYMYHLELLEEVKNILLPIHLAMKKVSYINDSGTKIIPERENGVIFEKLALDMIQLFDYVLAYEVDRNTSFASIKNKIGEDSIESARKLLIKNGYVL